MKVTTILGLNLKGLISDVSTCNCNHDCSFYVYEPFTLTSATLSLYAQYPVHISKKIFAGGKNV
jgi:hypothetical protein